MLIFYALCATVAGMIRLEFSCGLAWSGRIREICLIRGSFVNKELLCQHLFSGSRLSVSGSFFWKLVLRSTRAHNLLFRRTYPLQSTAAGSPDYIVESM